jgi:tetratricopeptide (TPR) repeat protein
MSNLARGYLAAGKHDHALILFKEALAKSRETIPKASPQLAGQLVSVGLSLLQAKVFTEAEPLLREGLAIRKEKEPDSWITFNAESLLGWSLLGQKKYSDAEPLLLKGYEGMKQREKTIPPQGSTRLTEALDRLIQLYIETNKPNEVKKWQAEKAKLQMTPSSIGKPR